MSGERKVAVEVDRAEYATLDRHAERQRGIDERSEVIEGVPALYTRGALYIFLAVIGVVLLVAWVAKVPVKVAAVGVLVPEGDHIPVQALLEANVSRVFVSVGDNVAQGQRLFVLHEASGGLDLTARKQELVLKRDEYAELKRAYATVKSFHDSPDLILTSSPQAFVAAGKGLEQLNNLRFSRLALDEAKDELDNELGKRTKQIEAEIGVTRRTIEQLRSNLKGLQENLVTRQDRLQNQRKELAELEQLAIKHIVPETQVDQQRETAFQTESQLADIKQQIGQVRLEISNNMLRIETLKAQLQKIEKNSRAAFEKAELTYAQALTALAGFLSETNTDIKNVEAEIQQLEGQVALRVEQRQELEISSPVAGTVTKLNVSSEGGLVNRGAVLAVIVPANTDAMILAKVKNKDVAFIREGQSAHVKVAAYPYQQFGTVSARVLRVFPNPGQPDFSVKLALQTQNIKVRGTDVRLLPGLQVQADIITERRRILNLLFNKMTAN